MQSVQPSPDLLSDLFAGDALRTSVIASFRMAAPWGLEVPHFGPALLYAVVEGAFEVEIEGASPLMLRAGDLLLLPRGSSHVAMSQAGVPAQHVLQAFEAQGVRAWRPGERPDGPIQVELRGDGDAARFLVVLLDFQDAAPGSLRMNLPKVIHLSMSENRLTPWLQAAVESIVSGLAEGRMGYLALSTKLAELVFIDTISNFLLLRADESVGWLRAMSEPGIARVLAQVHRRPAAAWTVEQMAREAGMSRSGFSATFLRLTGETPFAYLTGLRMRLASSWIAAGRTSVKAAAHDLGYASEKAFSVAFRRTIGRSPGSLRPTAAALSHPVSG